MLRRLLETNRSLNSYLRQSSTVLCVPPVSKSTMCSSKRSDISRYIADDGPTALSTKVRDL